MSDCDQVLLFTSRTPETYPEKGGQGGPVDRAIPIDAVNTTRAILSPMAESIPAAEINAAVGVLLSPSATGAVSSSIAAAGNHSAVSLLSPHAGALFEAFDVAKECLAEVFKVDQSSLGSQPNFDSLIDIFGSREANARHVVDNGGVSDAPTTSLGKNVEVLEDSRSSISYSLSTKMVTEKDDVVPPSVTSQPSSAGTAVTGGGLIISTTDAIRSFLAAASTDSHLSKDLRDLSTSLTRDSSSSSSLPYQSLKTIWLTSQPTIRPHLSSLLSGSNFIFTSPKPREKSEELKVRLKKLEEVADRKAYQELVKDITPKNSVEEPFSSYKDQLGFGIHFLYFISFFSIFLSYDNVCFSFRFVFICIGFMERSGKFVVFSSQERTSYVGLSTCKCHYLRFDLRGLRLRLTEMVTTKEGDTGVIAERFGLCAAIVVFPDAVGSQQYLHHLTGLHVVLTMFTGYFFGYAAFRALFSHSPAMSAAGGILGLVIGMLVETLLFIVRYSDQERPSPSSTSSSRLKIKKNQ
ncbi:hypothetical protein BUALT_Bualt08G0120200 [Buddleja alternifolia]|uniref:Uncharacterized protein n=1 Tax=Buddleja alternifolia TaxID=168488 RepID=A0AAV6XCS6_9LAMI|nr:hypothetical protein BUALT_Bualt08G0120200 [Buddleja alternifolia]